jgi:uncharacterized membrane protein
LLVLALRRRGMTGALLGLAGTAVVVREVTRHGPVARRLGIEPARSVELARSITIAADPHTTRALCGSPEPFVRVIQSIEHIEADGERWLLQPRTHRVGAFAVTIDGEADAIEWRTVAEEPIDGRLRLEFSQAPGERGTEIAARLRLRPRSAAGAGLARLLDGVGERWLGRQLARLKQLIETREIATADARVGGRRRPRRRAVATFPLPQEGRA